MLKTKEEIEEWLKTHGIENYTINEDCTIDVAGSVYLDGVFRAQPKSEWLDVLNQLDSHHSPDNRHGIERCDDGSYESNGTHYVFKEPEFEPFELPVRFRKIERSFYFSENNLKSLKGCPEFVGEDFECYDSQLESLKGGPKEVQGHYHVSSNKLTTLNGAPERVGKNFTCRNNRLSSLEGSPAFVGGNFECSCNGIRSLEGAPDYIGKSFKCVENPLESLKGLPSYVGRFFESHGNLPDLQSSITPQKVSGAELKIIHERKELQSNIAKIFDGLPAASSACAKQEKTLPSVLKAEPKFKL